MPRGRSKLNFLGSEMTWLARVEELLQPVSHSTPIFARRLNTPAGAAVIIPQQHPYCELSICTRGAGIQYIERDRNELGEGNVLLIAPGVPHWFEVTKFPHAGIAVYFLPSVLVESGPPMDGVSLLRRFTASRSWQDRVLQPVGSHWTDLVGVMEEMVKESSCQAFACHARLQALLVIALVNLVRSDRNSSSTVQSRVGEVKFAALREALKFIGRNYTHNIYSKQVAEAAGVSESTLKALFRQQLGMSWVRYLQSVRIHRAIELLEVEGASVQQVAMDVGFESLSHFNATFRTFTGHSPKR